MNVFKILFSASCALLVYITISVVCGQDGILAYNQLEEHKIVLAQNYSELSDMNSQLLIDTQSLKEDKTVLSAYAKKMGFVNDGEVLVKISGVADTPVFVYNAGSKVLRPQIMFVPDQLAKIIGIVIFISMYGFSLLFQLKKSFKSYDPQKVQA